MDWTFDPDSGSFPELLKIIRKSCDTFSLVVRDLKGLEGSGTALLDALRGSQISTIQTDSWPGTSLGGGQKVALMSFTLNDISAAKLLTVGTLTNFLEPNYPEDLTFYSRTAPTFVSITHEEDFYLDEGSPTFSQLKADLLAAGFKERK